MLTAVGAGSYICDVLFWCLGFVTEREAEGAQSRIFRVIYVTDSPLIDKLNS